MNKFLNLIYFWMIRMSAKAEITIKTENAEQVILVHPLTNHPCWL